MSIGIVEALLILVIIGVIIGLPVAILYGIYKILKSLLK